MAPARASRRSEVAPDRLKSSHVRILTTNCFRERTLLLHHNDGGSPAFLRGLTSAPCPRMVYLITRLQVAHTILITMRWANLYNTWLNDEGIGDYAGV